MDIPPALNNLPLPVARTPVCAGFSVLTSRMISHLSLFVADAAAQPPAQGLGSMLVPMVLFGVIIYFIAIRPQNQKQKALEKLHSSLKTGDKVVTTGGIHGIIANVKDGKTLLLKVADNVKLEIDKSAILGVEKSSDNSTPAITATPSAS